MSSFTCISCRVAFASADLQRAHYRSDWHRYNLKRKVAELPPVTAENFQQRVLAQKAQVEESEKETCSQCSICKKFFNTQNAFENHMKSKKHKETEAKQVQKMQSEVERKNLKNKEKGLDVPSERAQKDTINQALAEARKSPGPVKRKMNTSLDPAKVEAIRQLRGRGQRSSPRSKSQPDDEDEGEWEDEEEEEVVGGDEEMETEGSSEEDVDYPGTPLTEKQCLFCGREGEALDDNMQHMTVEHSFFIPDVEFLVDLEGLIKYLGEKVGGAFFCLWCNEKGRTFYSLEAAQGHMRDKGHTKMLVEGDAILEYADFFDFRKSYPDYQSEGAAGGEEEEETVEKEDLRVTDDETQLVLPSGSRVGHRALQRYWRQNLVPSMSHRTTGREAVGRLMAQYKALGWTGNYGEAAQRKVRDMQFVQKLKTKQRMQMGVRANKLQAHFRSDAPY